MEIARSVQSAIILSVETSGRHGSVALAKGPELLREINFSAPLRHSTELFDATQMLLQSNSLSASQIDHIYVSSGPGSFTGIRIGVTMAKVLAFANSAKIVTVNTLDVLAHNVEEIESTTTDRITKIGTILDAKRGQFFVAVYHFDGRELQKTTNDMLMSSAEFVSLYSAKEPICILGEGLVYYQNAFNAQGIHILDQKYWHARAAKVHEIGMQKASKGEFTDSMSLIPYYLRGPDVSERKG